MHKNIKPYSALLMLFAIGIVFAFAKPAAAQELPNPVISLTAVEPFELGGKKQLRYKFEVSNRAAYPAAMFAPAPELPPEGRNRTPDNDQMAVWLQKNATISAFCASALTPPPSPFASVRGIVGD